MADDCISEFEIGFFMFEQKHLSGRLSTLRDSHEKCPASRPPSIQISASCPVGIETSQFVNKVTSEAARDQANDIGLDLAYLDPVGFGYSKAG